MSVPTGRWNGCSHPRHQLVVALAGLGGEQVSLKEDAVHLLLDEARMLEGDRPADPRSFSERARPRAGEERREGLAKRRFPVKYNRRAAPMALATCG
jgi:hypothetical protein